MNNAILETIDWYNHDGVNFLMINDYGRNYFFDCVLQNIVRDKICIDIGFGTGLLSILALKHGAKKIISFESDKARYILGKTIIESLGLENKIELYNKRYNHLNLKDMQPIDVIFCETVNQNLWGEGLYSSIPRLENVLFVPGIYSLEFYALEIPDLYATRLINETEYQKFNPGVTVPESFIFAVNNLIDNQYGNIGSQVPLEKGLHVLNVWHAHTCQLHAMIKNQNIPVLASYSLDVNKKEIKTKYKNTEDIRPIDYTSKQIIFLLNTNTWDEKNIVLVPRASIEFAGKKLYLDSTSCWEPVRDPILLVKPNKNLSICHRLDSGDIEVTEIDH